MRAARFLGLASVLNRLRSVANRQQHGRTEQDTDERQADGNFAKCGTDKAGRDGQPADEFLHDHPSIPESVECFQNGSGGNLFHVGSADGPPADPAGLWRGAGRGW